MNNNLALRAQRIYNMNNIKVLLILLVAISCYSCSGKLYNEFAFYCIKERNIESYSAFVNFELHTEVFREAMDVLYHKYPETHISLEILKQLEITDTILQYNRPSLKTLQYSSQGNYSYLTLRDSIPVRDGILEGYWYVYRLKSPSTNNVFVISYQGLLCVHIASDSFRPYYLKDFTFAEEKAIEKEFETELLPKIEECIKKVQYLLKYKIWREDLE